VDLVRLASHLEAYQQVKPSILTLRACHRFGYHAVGIGSLSAEIIDMIVGELLDLHFPEYFAIWNQVAACALGI